MVYSQAQIRLVKLGGLYLIWLLIALLGIFLTLWLSPHGITVSADSVYYLMGAEGIRKGVGFVSFEAGGILKPITHWPPLYSLLIAFLGLTAVNTIFFALTVFLTSFLIYRATGKPIYSIAGGLLVATSPIMLKFSSMVLSETVFNFWILLLLTMMYMHAETGKDRWLVLMGVVSAFAVLTRYAGLFLMFPLAYYWWRKRLPVWKGFLLTISPFLTFILWRIYTFSIGGQETRHIFFHLPQGYHFRILMETFLKFVSFVPSALFNPMVLIAFVIAVLLIIFSRRQEMDGKIRMIIELSLVFAVSYLIFVFLSITFIDFYIIPDERIVSVLYPLLVVAFVSYISTFPVNRTAPLFLVLLVLNLYGDMVLRQEKVVPYSGFNGPYFRSLEVVDYVKHRLPPDAIIYSNGPDFIWYHTRRPASMLPKIILPVERRINPHFEEEMQQMVQHLTSGKGYIIILDVVRRRYLPDIREILNRVPVKDVIELKDAVILVVGNKKDKT